MLFIILIGCANGTTSDSLTFTVGQGEVIYTKEQRDALGLFWWPDGNIGAVNNDNGTYVFYAANGPQIGMTVGSLDKLGEYASQGITVLNQKTDNNYIAGGPVYKFDENTLLLFYHMEKHPGNDGTRFYSMLGVAASTTKDSQGHFIDFRDLGLIISSNRPYSDTIAHAVEMLGAGLAIYNGYVYIYFSDYIDGTNFWNVNQLAVARASISDIATAVNNNAAPAFMKYYNGSFSEYGLGGKSSPLESGNPSTTWLDMSYNSYLSKFLMVAAQYKTPNQVDLYLAVSNDGLNWSNRMLISNEAGEKFYPTIIGMEDEPRVTGKEFYIYYTHSIAGAWDRWSDAKLLRRKITLN
jgi:hypothetical protein